MEKQTVCCLCCSTSWHDDGVAPLCPQESHRHIAMWVFEAGNGSVSASAFLLRSDLFLHPYFSIILSDEFASTIALSPVTVFLTFSVCMNYPLRLSFCRTEGELAGLLNDWMLVTKKENRKSCAECLSSPYLSSVREVAGAETNSV